VKKTQATAKSTSKSEISFPMRGYECTDEDFRAKMGIKKGCTGVQPFKGLYGKLT